jgi:hypothetical protein
LNQRFFHAPPTRSYDWNTAAPAGKGAPAAKGAKK